MTESLKRNSFAFSSLLTAEQFQTEQHYFLEKTRLHNRSLHGFGVVSGLKAKRKAAQITLEPGFALDCAGNEIVVSEVVRVQLPNEPEVGTSVYLCVKYVERTLDDPSLIEEGFELVVLPQNPHRNHRRQKSRWPACGRHHEVVLARLQYKAGCWKTDRRYQAPAVR